MGSVGASCPTLQPPVLPGFKKKGHNALGLVGDRFSRVPRLGPTVSFERSRSVGPKASDSGRAVKNQSVGSGLGGAKFGQVLGFRV